MSTYSEEPSQGERAVLNENNPDPLNIPPPIVPPYNPMIPLTLTTDLIPEYKGDSSIKEFLQCIDDAANLGNWTEDYKVKMARTKLRGAARRTVEWNDIIKGQCSWALFSQALIQRFDRPELPVEALHKFRTCKQRVSEPIVEYSERLQAAANATFKRTGDAQRDFIIKEHLKGECLQQFMEGLVQPIQQRVMSSNPNTFEEAVEVAEREERIERRLNKGKITAQRAINTSFNQDNQQNISYQEQNGKTCYRCNQLGHFARNSPKRQCYRCLKYGHTAAVCRAPQPTTHVNQQQKFYNNKMKQENGSLNQSNLNSQGAVTDQATAMNQE